MAKPMTQKAPEDGGFALVVRKKIQQAGFQLLPDNGRYVHCFLVRSESSDSLYKVSFDSAPGARWWTCSCRGNISRGTCKHLKAMGLLGRAQDGLLPKSDPRRMLPGKASY